MIPRWKSLMSMPAPKLSYQAFCSQLEKCRGSKTVGGREVVTGVFFGGRSSIVDHVAENCERFADLSVD